MRHLEPSAQLNDELVGEHFVEARLRGIVEAVLAATDGVDLVTVDAFDGDGVRCVASTSASGRLLADLQDRLRDGPAFESVAVGHVIRCSNLVEESRWPRFGPAVNALGTRALTVYRLFQEGRYRADLGLYAARRGSISADPSFMRMAADHAALVIEHARVVRNLTLALESRTVIGQAMGLVMARYRLTPAQAFAFLRRESSISNTKLRTVCAELVAHPQALSRPDTRSDRR